MSNVKNGLRVERFVFIFSLKAVCVFSVFFLTTAGAENGTELGRRFPHGCRRPTGPSHYLLSGQDPALAETAQVDLYVCVE